MRVLFRTLMDVPHELAPPDKHEDDDPSQPVRLDVGGTIYVTQRATLASAPVGSLLERMFARGADSRWRPPRTADGSYFFDLDPVSFGVVLNVLRHGPDALHAATPETLHGVGVIADYLGLVALAAECTIGVAGREVAMAPKHRRRRIALVTMDSLWCDGFDLCDWTHVCHIVVLRHWTLRQIRETIADALCIEPHGFVVHDCLQRLNHTVRPSVRSSVKRDSDTIFDDAGFRAIKGIDACLLIEKGPSIVTAERPMLLLVKRFERESQTVERPVAVAVNSTHTIASMLPEIRARFAIEPDAVVCLFEEVCLDMIEVIDTTLAFGAAELEHGDILWIEAVVVDAAPTPPVLPTAGSRIEKRFLRSMSVPTHIPAHR